LHNQVKAEHTEKIFLRTYFLLIIGDYKNNMIRFYFMTEIMSEALDYDWSDIFVK